MSSRFADTSECMPHIANIGLIWIKLRVSINGWVRFVADLYLAGLISAGSYWSFFVLKVTTAAYVTIREQIAVTSVKKLATFFLPCRNSVFLLLTVWAAGPCQRQHVAPIFFGNGTTTQYKFYRRSKNMASSFYIRPMLWEVEYLHLSWFLLKMELPFFSYHRGPLVEWFAALNSL